MSPLFVSLLSCRSSLPLRARIGTSLFTAALFLGLIAPAPAQLPGTVDPAFAPSIRTDGSVTVIATQPDGKQVIGGDFSRVGTVTAPGLARLNADGSVDTGFHPPAGLGTASYVAVGANGKAVVLYQQFGDFSLVFTLRRLNADGSLDTSFVPPSFNGYSQSNELYVFVLAVQADGKVLVGGDFATDPNSSATTTKLIRYKTDGSLDTGFQLPSTLSGRQINSVLPLANGQVLVSGSFEDRSTTDDTALSLLRLNANGSRDSSYPLDPTQVGAGYDLTLQPDGKVLYLDSETSTFRSLGGVPRRLKADGTPDTAFAPTFGTGAVFRSLRLQADGKVLVGGYTSVVTSSNGSVTAKSGVVRLTASGGTDATFQPASPLVDNPPAPSRGNQINVLGLQPDGRILVGGVFKKFAGALHSSLGRLNANGSADASFANDLTNVGDAYAVAVLANGQPLVADSGVLTNGTLAPNLVSFHADGSLDTKFAASLTDGQSYYFSRSGLTPNNPAIGLQSDGKVLLAGVYEPFYAGYNTVRRFNPAGTLDAVFDLEPYYAVFKAVVPQADGHIYVAGTFAEGSEEITYPLARLNADGSVDTAFTPADDPGATVYGGSLINALAVQTNGKVLAGGAFNYVNNLPQPGVLRFNANGSLDKSFSAGVLANEFGNYGSATVLALQKDGKVLVGGDFTAVGGVPVSYLARLNANGSLDTGFNTGGAGPDGAVNSVAVQANGKILIGGAFISVNGVPSAGVARLNADGTIDPLFFRGRGTGGTGVVNSVALAPDGGVFAGGTFTEFDGQARDGVVRLVGGEVIAPVVTSATTATARVGQAFSYHITASNGPTSFAATGLPAGLGVNTVSGLISGTPTVAGTFAVTFAATNAAGAGTATLTITVLPLPPQVTVAAAFIPAQVGQAFSYQIVASNDPTSYAATRLPAGLSVDTASGLISGTPTAAGSYDVVLSAANAGGTGTAALTLTVAPAFPVATLVATTPLVTAGSGEFGAFTLSLSEPQDHDVFVNLTIKGSAVNGTDYVLLKTTKKIKAGKTSKRIKVTPLGEGAGTGIKRTVVFILQPGDGYEVGTVGKVKVKIVGR